MTTTPAPRPRVRRAECACCSRPMWAIILDGTVTETWLTWDAAVFKANLRALALRQPARAVFAVLTGESERAFAPLWKAEQDARIATEVARAVTHFETQGAAS